MRSWRNRPAVVLSAFGVALFAAATLHHSAELVELGRFDGPVLGLALDGVPALALVIVGLRLRGSDFSRARQWEITGWTLGGAIVFVAFIGATVLVRSIEGRVVDEPAFLLLASAGFGANAGLLAGVLYATARTDARRARRTSEALSFVNSVLRHDIRNNVGIVRGNAALIESRADDEDVVEYAETIRRQADESVQRIECASTIADTLVDDADLATVDLAAVTEAVCERVESAFEASISVDAPETAPVRANDGLRSVVSNLVENAVNHSDADEPAVEVRVDVGDDHARLAVADDGPGVPKDLLDGSDPAAADGGLYLVQTLVDQYDGDVWVEQTGPEGSVIAVELPRAREQGEEE